MCNKTKNVANKKEPPYEIAIGGLRSIQDNYIESNEHKVYPIDTWYPYPINTWYAIDFAIKSMQKLKKIEQIIKDHDNDNMPEDYFYIDKIREVLRDNKLTEELKNEN